MTILHRNCITAFCTPLSIDLLYALNVAGYNSSLIAYLPCGMKFFVGVYFLRIGNFLCFARTNLCY